MRVSVLIINYNHGRYLGDAIRSVQEQTRAVDEIVVVDDGSTDDSRQVLGQFPAVISVFQENGGPSAATNIAVASATGDIAVFLDADDLMLPDRVRQVVDAFEDAPDAQWVWHPLRHIERDSGADCGVDQQMGFTPGRQDLRADVQRGRLPMTAPATSGLSWRTPFLRTLMPIPVAARGQDLYLKFASMALAIGVMLEDVLALQGIHHTNAYTSRSRADRRVFGARNSLEMLAGFTELGAPLDALTHRFAAESVVRSRLGADLTPDQRRRLVRFVLGLPVGRRRALALAMAVALLRGAHDRVVGAQVSAAEYERRSR